MTKYKEYLRAHGYQLECDYAFLPYYELEAVKTCVTYNGIVITHYYNNTVSESTIYYSNGDGVRFNIYSTDADLITSPYSMAYMFWLRDAGYAKSEKALDIAMYMYRYSEKVRIAFGHMQAGIMDADVFYKWFAKRFRKSIANKIYR